MVCAYNPLVMAKVELKTKETDASVEDFLNAIENETRRRDGFRVLEIYKRVTGEQPKMWGPAIIGFGHQVLKYENGREMDWMKAAFSPRKQNMTLYVICDSPKQPALLAKLGKHKTSRACLYINKLSDVDEKVLEAIIRDSYKYEASQ
jgi:uncharacterized protein DUF1801